MNITQPEICRVLREAEQFVSTELAHRLDSTLPVEHEYIQSAKRVLTRLRRTLGKLEHRELTPVARFVRELPPFPIPEMEEYLDLTHDHFIDGPAGARALVATIRAALPRTVFECDGLRIHYQGEE